MIIGIDVATESSGLQVFDYLYAWDQYQQAKNNYKSTLTIKHNIDGSEDVKILFAYMPRSLNQYSLSNYDLILLCNGSEPMEICHPAMLDACRNNPNVYILSNSITNTQLSLHHKIIQYSHNIPLCHDYWTRPFYPQFFDRRDTPRTGSVFVVNGENRSYRHYAVELIKKSVPEVKIKSSISDNITATKANYMSEEDRIFCEFVNSSYPISQYTSWYYRNRVQIGVDEKFGSIAPGYFFIDEYYQNKVIVFPETSWINNELSITEKGLKCFMTGCLPMPMAGANVNKLYNKLGYTTAWNLLPTELQLFDAELDHVKRYQGLATAVAWLHHNPTVLDSNEYHQMTQNNYVNFLSGGNGTDLTALARILNITYPEKIK